MPTHPIIITHLIIIIIIIIIITYNNNNNVNKYGARHHALPYLCPQSTVLRRRIKSLVNKFYPNANVRVVFRRVSS